MEDKKLPMQRRLRFRSLFLISQILLITLVISRFVHMVTIALVESVIGRLMDKCLSTKLKRSSPNQYDEITAGLLTVVLFITG